MKLTYKAIARAAGYRVNSFYGDLSRWPSVYGYWFFWKDLTEDYEEYPQQRLERQYFENAEDAYRDCCIQCGLVEMETE